MKHSMNQTHVVPTATGKYSECEISKRSFVVYRAVCKRAKIRHKGSQGVAVRFVTDTVGGWNGLTTCPNSLAPLDRARVRGYDACHVGCPNTAAHSWSKGGAAYLLLRPENAGNHLRGFLPLQGRRRLQECNWCSSADCYAIRWGWRSGERQERRSDRKTTRLNSSHVAISYAVFCLKKKKKQKY